MKIEGLYLVPGDPSGWPLGPGYRTAVAFNPGRRNVSLLALGTLKVARVPLGRLRQAQVLPLNPRRLARILERRRRSLNCAGVAIRDKQIKAVVAALRSGSR